MRFTSFDSRCFSFDDRVNGSDAVKNNDTIRAVVHSTGSIEDYYTPGIAQPSREDLARLIWSTYEKAGLDVSSIRYVEAHGKYPSRNSLVAINNSLTCPQGTGTPIGDLIEDGAIGCVFHAYRSLHVSPAR
jgi:acyl transferase domain-containing protein